MKTNSQPFWVRIPYTLIGAGGVENVGALAKKLGGNKVLIVTDQGVVKAGLVDKVKQLVEKEGMEIGVFDRCEPDAPTSVIRSCAKFTKDGGYNLIIGVGGGSTLDTAKVASILATGKDVAHEDIDQWVVTQAPRRGLPRIQISTTAGTGSETSLGAVITSADGSKKVIFGEYLLPDVAIVDPLMTLNLPPEITAHSGMDALSHAIEAYTNNQASIVSDMLAERAIKLISDSLRIACYRGSKDLDARSNMAIAAYYATIALIMSGGAQLVHGMGHSLQMKAHCTHGVSCSIMLPYVMEFNVLADESKYARIAELMGEKVEGLPLRDAAEKAVEAVRKLTLDIGMPQRLRDIGVKKEEISGFVDILFTVNLRQVNNNYRSCSRESATKIFEAAW